MSREEHLQWAKARALRYVEAGETDNALASFFSDLRKHADLRDHPVLQLGGLLFFGGRLQTTEAVRSLIEGTV